MWRSPSHFAVHHYGQPGDLAHIAAAAAATRAAIDALDSGDSDLARRLWEAVDGPLLLNIWDRWNARAREVGPRWNPTPPEPVGPKTASVPTALCLKVYERDCYRCRYCGIDVFLRSSGSPISRLVAAFPALTPGLSAVNGALRGSGRSGAIRNVDYSKFLWSMAAPEHVFPRSLGGPTNEANVVTACWGCNAWKGDVTLEQLGVAFRI